MRLLLFDHFFGQDIDALTEAATARGIQVRVVPWDLIRDEAMKVFPAEVGDGIESYGRTEYDGLRREWRAKFERLLEELYSGFPFDAFVAGSDMLFYLREAPGACHRLGVPFFCVQKETTISPNTLRVLAEENRRHVPVIADRMTVCSERSRTFYERSGATPGDVVVTGQPRFDYYAQREGWPSSPPYGEDGPAVLFFSYMTDAYHPDAGRGKAVWADLHRETEEGLFDLARRGWRVLIKPHPQQEFASERRRLKSEAKDLLGRSVFLVPALADTRPLVAGSDVIVGFQTTALIESLAAGKPVVYTAWDREAERQSRELIPFGDWNEAIHVVSEKEGLAPTVDSVRGTRLEGAAALQATAVVTEHIGVVDGRASDRSLDEIERTAERFRRERSPEVEQRRLELEGRRPPLRMRRRVRRGAKRLRVGLGAALGR